MNSLFSFLRSEWLECLQHTLLHTLWQGVLWCIVLFIALHILPVTRPQHRYLAAVGVLCGLLISAMLTWCVLDYNAKPSISTLEGVEMVAASTAGTVESPMLETTLPPSTPAVQSTPHKPQQWLLPLWFVGVCVMLLRMLRMLWGANTIRHACHPLEDPIALACLDDLKRKLGIVRDISLLVGEHIVSPAVVGIVWPALILPASMVSGLPPTHFQAILAHELAHVRRYDHLVNFFQLIVESLLYFNPTVWWISRQIRIEREACCDAIAASVTGSTTDYVEALARATQYLRTLTPAVALPLGGADHKTGLIDRVRRLLVPGYLPKMRLPWYSIVIGFASVAVLLAGLYESSALTVLLAGRFLSDGERAAVIEEINESYGDPIKKIDYLNIDFYRISGTIQTYDGKSLSSKENGGAEPNQNGVFMFTETRNANWRRGVQVHESSFTYTDLNPGSVHIAVNYDGYAPTIYGPLELDNGDTIENVNISLEKALHAKIQFVASDGTPIKEFDFSGSYKYMKDNSIHWTLSSSKDEPGVIIFEQGTEPVPIEFTIKTKGYQREHIENLIIPGNTLYEWKLRPATPVTGKVIDAETKQPIGGAELVLVLDLPKSNRSVNKLHSEEMLEAVTDDSGSFTIDTFNENKTYLVAVRAPGYGIEVIEKMEHFAPGAAIALPRRYVEGVVRGNLDLLGKNKDGQPIIQGQSHILAQSVLSSIDYEASLQKISDNELHFRFNELLPGYFKISFGPKIVHLNLEKSVTGLEVNLEESSTERVPREVVFNLIPPDENTSVTGKLAVDSLEIDKHGQRIFRGAKYYTIENNQVKQSFLTPGEIYIYSDGLVGFCLNMPNPPGSISTKSIDIPSGEGPYVLDVPLAPAGSIYGEVVNVGGSPAEKTKTYVEWLTLPDIGRFDFDSLNYSERDLDGTFNFSPLPYEGTYRVFAVRDNMYVYSDPISISESKSIHHVKLQFVEGVDIKGTVFEPSGTPAKFTRVQLRFFTYKKSFRTLSTETDQNGKFLFIEVNPDYLSDAIFIIDSHNGTRKLVLRYKDFKKTNRIDLEPGLTLQGLVIDKATGKPIPNIEFSLKGEELDIEENYRATANVQGRFVFQNLSPNKYRLSVGFAQNASAKDIYVNPAKTGFIEVPATL